MLRSKLAGVAGAAFGLSLAGGVLAAPPGYSLRAAAGSSPRPTECLTRPGVGRRDTFWDRARNPRLSRYCVFLARGYAKLSGEPRQAASLADQALKVLPESVAPLLLKARALLAQGDPTSAFATFEAARQLDDALRLSPSALHDYALSAADTGHGAAALRAYRQLVPMAGLLPLPGHKQRIYVEAALLVMALDPGAVQEAAAYLLEARRSNWLPALKPFILAGLALALDRQGRPEEARGVASEVIGVSALVERAEAHEGKAQVQGPDDLRIFGHELWAMIAMVSTFEDREVSREYWQAYLERVGNEAPWAAHAQNHLVRSGGRR